MNDDDSFDNFENKDKHIQNILDELNDDENIHTFNRSKKSVKI